MDRDYQKHVGIINNHSFLPLKACVMQGTSAKPTREDPRRSGMPLTHGVNNGVK